MFKVAHLLSCSRFGVELGTAEGRSVTGRPQHDKDLWSNNHIMIIIPKKEVCLFLRRILQ